MAKDPAFLFYPNDYMGGTMGMTFEEKGAYMDLLIMQFNRGHMGAHMIGQTVGQLWDKIQDKFIKDESGLYYNKRLEEEQNRRKAFIDSRLNNLDGHNQHSKGKKKKGHMDGHTSSRGEDEDRDENISAIEGGVYREIIDDLNKVLDSGYSHKTKKTREFITARIKEGRTLEDFKKVHRRKYADWSDDKKYVKFLRPETLYSPKFEGYLNAPEPKNKKGISDERKKAYDDITEKV